MDPQLSFSAGVVGPLSARGLWTPVFLSAVMDPQLFMWGPWLIFEHRLYLQLWGLLTDFDFGLSEGEQTALLHTPSL